MAVKKNRKPAKPLIATLRDAATALRSQAAAVPSSDGLRGENEKLRAELNALHCYIESKHNGYEDPQVSQPATHMDALRDLIEENESLASMELRELRAELAAQDAASKALVARLTDGSELAAVPVHAEAEAAIKALCDAVRKSHSGISFGNAKNRVLALMLRAAAPPQPVRDAVPSAWREAISEMLKAQLQIRDNWSEANDAVNNTMWARLHTAGKVLFELVNPRGFLPAPAPGPTAREALTSLRKEFRQRHDDTFSNRCHEEQDLCERTRSWCMDIIGTIDHELAKLDKPAPLQADAAGDKVLREFLEWVSCVDKSVMLLALQELARRSLATKEGT